MAVPPSRPRASLLCVCAAQIVAAFAGPARGEGAGAEKLVEQRFEWHRQQARREAADEEARRLAAPRVGGAAVRNFKDPAVVLTELRPALAEDYKSLRDAATKLAESSRARREAAQQQWSELYRQRIAFQEHVEQQETTHGFSFESGAQQGFTPTLFDAAALLWALVIFLVACRLSHHVRRVSIRKARRAAIAALAVLFAVPGCSNAPARQSQSWAVREQAKLTADVKEAAEQANAAVAAADQKWKTTLESWVALVAAPGTADDPVEKTLRDGEIDVRASLNAAALDARLAERLAAEAEAERAKLTSDATRLSELTSGAKWRAVGFAALRCAAIAILFALAVAPYWRALRSEAAVIQEDARKCPRCFGTKLVVETSAPLPEHEEAAEQEENEIAPLPRYRARRKVQPRKAKAAAEEEAAETGYVECQSCSFRFLRSYQKVRRLCFPVVGVRASGKTHMLATGYDRVRKGLAPTAAAVQPAPSLGDARFENYIDMILNLKRDAGGTVHAMPDPVMLHLRDADPAGANTALVNLFDYSGELVDSSVDVDRLKKQAVKMDGFMLFLDPTQLYGDGANVTLDRQLARINEFVADLREARGVPVGEVIPVPVAVCITKFDLLVTENPIQSQAVPFIRKLLAEMNPPPKQTTLGTIQDRGALVEEMLELMFRGVDIRGLLEGYFGPRVMFFPVSSVSLFENELGVRDLSKRTIAPFGVAEPFIWLLHMHGYQVLA